MTPSRFVVAYADFVRATDKREAQQVWVALDAGQEIGVGKPHVLESSVAPGFALRINQRGQSIALDEAPELVTAALRSA